MIISAAFLEESSGSVWIVEQNFTRKILLWLLALSTLTAIALWTLGAVTNPVNTPINSVKIEGSLSKISKPEVESAITPYVMHEGFFSVDVGALKEHLVAIPWVSTASISRLWPDSIVVRIEEEKAIANWREHALLNPKGQLFMPQLDSFPKEIPLLKGPQGQHLQMLEDYNAMTTILAPLGLAIKEMDLSARRSLRIKLNNNMEILLGRVDSLARLKRFVAVYDKVFDNAAKLAERIDLRYSAGMAVHWQS